MFTKRLRFEKIHKGDENRFDVYYVIPDEYVQEIIGQYCKEHYLNLKSLMIDNDKIEVKIRCSKDEIQNLWLFLLTNYCAEFKNFKV